ncbi:MAG: signal peptidase II [Phycisphaerales bacterium]
MPTEPQSTPKPLGPVRCARAWGVLLTVAVVGLVTDLATKSIAFATVAQSPVLVKREDVLAVASPSLLIETHEPVVVIPRVLEFTLVLNPGAVFGVGAGQRVVFIIFTCFAMGFAMYMFARWTVARDWSSHAALGMLISGGLGNLYDRLRFACVRDFIHPLPDAVLPFGWEFPWGGRVIWPYVSNVADLLLIIGVAMLVWRALRPYKAALGTPGPVVRSSTRPDHPGG